MLSSTPSERADSYIANAGSNDNVLVGLKAQIHPAQGNTLGKHMIFTYQRPVWAAAYSLLYVAVLTGRTYTLETFTQGDVLPLPLQNSALG